MTSQENLQRTLDLRASLLKLQKELLTHLKDQFEKENGRQVTPSEWLQVIMVAQRYVWLKELTSLIVDIDLLTEMQEITEEQASVARFEVERLFFNPDNTGEFNKLYKQVLMTGPSLLMSHGEVKEAHQKLPASKKSHTPEKAAQVRKNWHEEHKMQSRKRRS